MEGGYERLGSPNSILSLSEQTNLHKREHRLHHLLNKLNTRSKTALPDHQPPADADPEDIFTAIDQWNSKDADFNNIVLEEFSKAWRSFDKNCVNEVHERVRYDVEGDCMVSVRRSLLFHACSLGAVPIVALLLSTPGIQIEGVQSDSGTTCLHEATERGHAAIVAQLLIKGARPERIRGVLPCAHSPLPLDLHHLWETHRLRPEQGFEGFLPEKAYDNRKGVSDSAADDYFRTDFLEMAGSFTASEPREPDFDLNNRFQRIAEKLFSLPPTADAAAMWKLNVEFVRVTRDFLHVAKTVSRVIISEVRTDMERKTIKPASHLEGYLGGEKYIVHSVLFKFAFQKDDPDYSTPMATKIAGHELKSLVQIWEAKTGFCLPLQCIIDYLGYRMVAMLYLPISSKTLMVGSSDSGNSYVVKDEVMREKLMKIGRDMYLKEHYFLGNDIYVPFDLEAHRGVDGREYLIDCSRLYPPVPNDNSRTHRGYLYRLFRPEFIKNYYSQPLNRPLNSDLYRPETPESHINDQKEAFVYLQEKAIPFASETFDNLARSVISIGLVIPGKVTWNPSIILHQLGVNLRYMGKVYQYCKTKEAKVMLLIEMAARIIKELLRDKIRRQINLRSPGKIFPLENEFIILLVNELNEILFEVKKEKDKAVEEVNEYKESPWKHIEEEMIRYFECPRSNTTFQADIYNFSFELNGRVDYPLRKFGHLLLFDRIKKMLAFKVNKQYLERLYYGGAKKLKVVVVSGVGQKIKHMNIISHAEGWLLKTDDPVLALKKFADALDSSPLNKFTLRNYASLFAEVESRKNTVLEQNERRKQFDEDLMKYVTHLFKLALFVDPKDTHTLYQFGKFLYSRGCYPEAEEYFIRSIEIDDTHQSAWISLIEVLKAQKKPYDKLLRVYDFFFPPKLFM